MSIFARSYYPTSYPSHYNHHHGGNSFNSLFRLLDDFDNYTRQAQEASASNNGSYYSSRTQVRTFTPKFDVKETQEAYELQGELPGIDQKDVEIEFTDTNTLLVKGRTERVVTSNTPPTSANAIEAQTTEAITENGEAAATEEKHKSHQPTVEDEPEEGETEAKAQETTTEEPAATEEADNTKQVEKASAPAQENQPKYWISERSIGEFARQFNFPAPVDQSGVTASMNNGVLNIVVPKAKKQENRKIAITSA